MFIIGDKVAYPMHGAGTIESVEEKEVLNKKQQYFVLHFAVGGMKVMVPCDHVAAVGLRSIIPEAQVGEVLTVLKQNIELDASNWNKRYRENLEKLKSGDIFEIAMVVRMLTTRDKEKKLSTGERKMLNSARQILISELVLSSGRCETDIIGEVDAILEN